MCGLRTILLRENQIQIVSTRKENLENLQIEICFESFDHHYLFVWSRLVLFKTERNGFIWMLFGVMILKMLLSLNSKRFVAAWAKHRIIRMLRFSDEKRKSLILNRRYCNTLYTCNCIPSFYNVRLRPNSFQTCVDNLKRDIAFALLANATVSSHHKR